MAETRMWGETGKVGYITNTGKAGRRWVRGKGGRRDSGNLVIGKWDLVGII
jgi:hypothetical protein